jgi:hypothetical protein
MALKKAQRSKRTERTSIRKRQPVTLVLQDPYSGVFFEEVEKKSVCTRRRSISKKR